MDPLTSHLAVLLDLGRYSDWHRVLDPCPEEIQRLCYLMPTPEHRVEGALLIIGSLFLLWFTRAIDKWNKLMTDDILEQLDETGAGERMPIGAFSPGFLGLQRLAIRGAYVLCASGLLIGASRLITNK